MAGLLPFLHYLRPRELLPSLHLKDVGQAWRMLLAIKNSKEVQRFRLAAECPDLAMDALRDALCPGVTEYMLADAR